MRAVVDLLIGDAQADRVVPPTGMTARLTVFVAATMAFLAVFALALSLSAGRAADRWADELAQSATLRLPVDAPEADVQRALEILRQTPGVKSATALDEADQLDLLRPWLGPDPALEVLPIPPLIEVVAEGEGYDPEGLRVRLAGELPEATLDDHGRWRAPLQAAASRLRLIGAVATLLIGAAMAAMIWLAAQAALAANVQVIRVLRLVGARDVYIARAFVRRFTIRVLIGAGVGSALGLLALQLLPGSATTGGFLADIGFRGAGWLWPLVIPLLAAIVGFAATRAAALARLREQT